MISDWLRRRREAREAAYARRLEELRAKFPGTPEQLIRAIAVGGVIGACALSAIAQVDQQKAEDERLRRIIREELNRHQQVES